MDLNKFKLTRMLNASIASRGKTFVRTELRPALGT